MSHILNGRGDVQVGVQMVMLTGDNCATAGE